MIIVEFLIEEQTSGACNKTGKLKSLAIASLTFLFFIID